MVRAFALLLQSMLRLPWVIPEASVLVAKHRHCSCSRRGASQMEFHQTSATLATVVGQHQNSKQVLQHGESQAHLKQKGCLTNSKVIEVRQMRSSLTHWPL
jgi:hypothetical protein